jgi:hypothetical protein
MVTPMRSGRLQRQSRRAFRESARFSMSVFLAQHERASSEVDTSGAALARGRHRINGRKWACWNPNPSSGWGAKKESKIGNLIDRNRDASERFAASRLR